jgi:hypothetical protein
MKIYKTLNDYIQSYDFLSEEICKDMINFFKLLHWHKHAYYDYKIDENDSYEDDLYVNNDPTYYTLHIQHTLHDYIAKYLKHFDYPWFPSWHGYTQPRLNRYPVGTSMRPHCDHIHSCFDGKKKGVPILTLLGFLNDDFEGGDFYICGKKFPTKTGQLIIFPSNFSYPHWVSPITKGERYSFVSWVW